MPLPRACTLWQVFLCADRTEASKVQYTKPPRSVSQQATKLAKRGLNGDKSIIEERLEAVSYTRLDAYWSPFQNTDKTFRPDTCFNIIWRRYIFDRELRLLLLDAMERIEVAVRTQLALHHSLFHGAFAYAENADSLPRLAPKDLINFRKTLLNDISVGKREDFIASFDNDHGTSHPFLPVWNAIEVMSFGTVVRFYRGADDSTRRVVAEKFNVHDTVLDSWLLSLNVVRNLCAHHSRVWNRVYGVKPKLPVKKNDIRWHEPLRVGNNRLFGILTVCKHCMDCVAPQSDWPKRILAHIDQYPDIPLYDMGFPTKWVTCPIWQGLKAT